MAATPPGPQLSAERLAAAAMEALVAKPPAEWQLQLA